MTNSLIKSGNRKGLFGQEKYTQEDLDFFIDNYNSFSENQIDIGYGFDMKTLSLVSSNETYTKLLYNGEEITLPSQIINDILISDSNTYSAEKIEEKLTEIINTIGVGGGTGGASVNQKVFLDVIKNDVKYISTIDEENKDRFVVQVYKLIPGTENVVEILKKFDNGEKDNFYYDKNIIEFNGVMKIKDRYIPKNYINEDGLVESETINKDDYVELYGIEVI